mmetsp:Transcript_2661/g.5159  ORF Transcript_2661/g.5159 Transcript_2661/m.5159 type:complete len:116 (+) Transcript_2661:75-422(+)
MEKFVHDRSKKLHSFTYEMNKKPDLGMNSEQIGKEYPMLVTRDGGHQRVKYTGIIAINNARLNNHDEHLERLDHNFQYLLTSVQNVLSWAKSKFRTLGSARPTTRSTRRMKATTI